jgi:hypothetical protein
MCVVGKNVLGLGHSLTSVNLGIFLEILNKTSNKITVSSNVAFVKNFVLMLRKNPLPLFLGRLNLFGVFLE